MTSWSDQLGALRLKYEHQPESLTTRPVVLRWWTPSQTYMPMFGSFREARRFFTGEGRPRLVALYNENSTRGDEAFLVFEVRPGLLKSRSGIAAGTVYGDPLPGGSLCLVTEDVVLWPVHPPEAPSRSTPRL